MVDKRELDAFELLPELTVDCRSDGTVVISAPLSVAGVLAGRTDIGDVAHAARLAESRP